MNIINLNVVTCYLLYFTYINDLNHATNAYIHIYIEFNVIQKVFCEELKN